MNSKSVFQVLIPILFLSPLFIFAQTSGIPYTPLVGQIPGLTETTGSGNLGTWLNGVYMFLIGVAGALAIVMIFWAGFQFVVSGDNAGKRSEAKNRILAALGGLLLALASFLILNTINPQLVNINLGFNKVTPPEIQTARPGMPGVDPNAARPTGTGTYASDPYGSFFGTVGVDPYFVRHDDYNNPLWNYFHGNGQINPQQQANTGLGIPSGGLTGVSPGSTSGSITLSYFGGPIDVRITSDGYALQYCNNRYGGNVGEYYRSTTVGDTEYRWCYALDGSGNKIYFPQGSVSAHGGYFETTAVSLERFSAMNPQSFYVAYPLNGKQLSELPDPTGVSNSRLRGYQVAVTSKSGQVFTGYIADRGPHGSLNKLDVSKGMYDAINRAGGAASARLVNNSGQTVTSF